VVAVTDLSQEAVLAFLQTAYNHYDFMYAHARDPVEAHDYAQHAMLVMAIGFEVAGDRFVRHNLGPFGAWRSVIGRIREIEASTWRALRADWGDLEWTKAEELWYRAVEAQRLVEAAGSDAARWCVL
jgi:hypothetical protein